MLLVKYVPSPNLTPQQACTVSTLFFEGYNNIFGIPRENNDGGYTNTFCSIALIPRLVDAVNTNDATTTRITVNYTLALGYCENRIRDLILKRLSDAC